MELNREIQEAYNNIDTNQFFTIIFVVVLVSMIFENGLKFVKGRMDTRKKEEKEYTNYTKAMIILLVLYIVFLIVFFLVSQYAVGIPIEITIALQIASICMVLISTFFKFRMLLPKIKK